MFVRVVFTMRDGFRIDDCKKPSPSFTDICVTTCGTFNTKIGTIGRNNRLHMMNWETADHGTPFNSPYDALVRSTIAALGGKFTVGLVGAFLPVFDPGGPKCKVATKKCSQNGPPEDGYRIGADQLPHKRHARVFEHAHNILPHQVQILLAHLSHLKRGNWQIRKSVKYRFILNFTELDLNFIGHLTFALWPYWP